MVRKLLISHGQSDATVRTRYPRATAGLLGSVVLSP
jgi:hypothetical protein